MDDGSEDFLALLGLQKELEFVTKSELLELVRDKGVKISERQLTTYVSEGVLPKSVRIGSRGGAYPRIAVDLICFISGMRARNVPLTAIRELLPVWRYVRRAIDFTKELDLAELQRIAYEVTSDETAWAMPYAVQHALPCAQCVAELGVKFLNKDGVAHQPSELQPIIIGFVLASYNDEDGEVEEHARTSVTLATPDDASTIVLGLPEGIHPPPRRRQHRHEQDRRDDAQGVGGADELEGA